jgi:hypothetical protein
MRPTASDYATGNQKKKKGPHFTQLMHMHKPNFIITQAPSSRACLPRTG